jgi:uncharacterized protein (DUF58 family)
MTIRRTFWGLLVLLAVAGLLGYLLPRVFTPPNPDNTIRIFTRLIFFFAGMVIFAWIWARFSLTGVTLNREARVQRQQVGQIFEERYRVINNSPLTRLWLEIRDQSSLPGNFGSRVLSVIGAHQQRSHAAYTLLMRRGVFILGPTMLVSGDPFGLFQKSRIVPSDQELLVLPYIVELSAFPAPIGQFPGGKAVLRRATEVTPQAAGVREYFPGDALRSIHWPSSARKDRLMVKEFEQDPQADVWLFLDAHETVQAHKEEQVALQRVDQFWRLWRDDSVKVTLPADSFEYAVSAAGSLASYYVKRGRLVGLICAGEVVTVIPPERGERQLNKILENLAFLKGNGHLPLIGLVESEASQLPRASTVVLISPSTDPSVELAIDSLLMRSMKPILVHIDAESFGGLPGGIEFAATVRKRAIPVQIVRNGAPLKESLEETI